MNKGRYFLDNVFVASEVEFWITENNFTSSWW